MINDAGDPAFDATGRTGRPGNENVVDLLGRLTNQGAHLAQEQLSLMQAEVREAANDVKQAAAAFTGAAVVGIAGLGVLLMGLGYLLGDAIDNVGLGIAIVGLLSLIVAAIMAAGARKKVAAANLKPTRTIRTVEDTPDAVTGHTHSAGGHNGNRI
jgi:hypothetical protein